MTGVFHNLQLIFIFEIQQKKKIFILERLKEMICIIIYKRFQMQSLFLLNIIRPDIC